MNEKQEQIATWGDIETNEFVKFEEGKRNTYALQNWVLKWVEQDNFDKTAKEKVVKLVADIVALDGVKCSKKLGTTSKRLINGLKPFLVNQPAGSIVFVSVKKIGKESATNYDVELRDPTPVQG